MYKFKFFKKEEAVFMIYLIVSLSLVFQISQDVEAQSNNVCCELTKPGDSCVYTSRDQCNTQNGRQISPLRCEDSFFCVDICCVDQNSCSPNTPKSSCQTRTNTRIFSDNTCLSVSQCNLGCCTVGNDKRFIQEIQCKNLADIVLGSNYNFGDVFKKIPINECILQSQNENGCCISNGICSSGNELTCAGNFNSGKECSTLNECSNCERHSYKDCRDGNIYWFDSCGNTEDLAETCNFNDGSLCVKENDNAFCRNLDCPNTKKYEGWDYTGKPRKNGESWCIYDGPTGNFTDRPGSRHYKASCLNGEEIVENCRDYREQVCIPLNYKEGFSQAECVNNNIYDSIVKVDISSVPTGFKFWETEQDLKNKCNKGSRSCTVVYLKEDRFSDWECEGNCFCETQGFIDEANNYCKSFGDCGFNYNTLGKEGSGGLNVYWTGTELGDSPNTLSENYLNFLKKFGIYGGMRFLDDESKKIINAPETEANKYLHDILIFGPIAASGSYAVLNYLATGFIPNLMGLIIGSALGASLAPIFGEDPLEGAYVGAAVTAAGASSSLSTAATTSSYFGPPGWIVAAILAIASLALSVVYSGGGVREKTINIDCNPWQAPLGGSNCGKCTEDSSKECTEYRCRSLGINCRISDEFTDHVQCVNINTNDINSPKISPLLIQDYSLIEDRLGYKIKEPVDPSEQLTFGIITDEDATCKYDFTVFTKYEDMRYSFGDTLFKKERNLTLFLEGNKEFNYYVKCQDTNGNIGHDYLINFRTKKEIDKQAPIIIDTSIENNAIVPNILDKTLLELELNEPSICRYDVKDKKYDEMTNQGICNNEFSSVPVKYNCKLALNNLKKGANGYYFRCRDFFNNTNPQSYKFSLIKSEPLVITVNDVTPKDFSYQNDITLSLTTSLGSNQGISVCKFSEQNLPFERMIEFKNTNGVNHLQLQTDLKKGNYNYYVKCRDNVGNEDSEKISFKVVLDGKRKDIVSFYKDANALYLILNVESNCEYNNKDFIYGQGIKMGGEDTTTHVAPLTFNDYYIKCKDNDYKDIKGIKINV